MDDATWTILLSYGLPILGALAGYAYKALSARIGVDKMAHVQDIAGMVVSAVEQTYQTLPGTGAAKKQAAIKLVKAGLADLHITLSDETVSTAIEAAVRALPPSEAPSRPDPGV